ncbi:dynein axonemal heavy chain 7-like [Schistocerca cancellata]|uniref:dynein axonemal heavy chain 7-like n=1 Tax=Schistocerca cancellata TaxID=274614 RepID=UPI002119B05C|nr:dynein axonemal heavy chain 7-like [Schistocerca cancellata]
MSHRTWFKLRAPCQRKRSWLLNFDVIRGFPSEWVFHCPLASKQNKKYKWTNMVLWMHEALRVFYDRLSNGLDRETIFAKICSAITQYFPEPPEIFLNHLPSFDGMVTEDLVKGLSFGKYFNMQDDEVSQWYEEILNFDDIQTTAERVIEKYNEEHEIKMDIVLFRSALEHLIHLCRIMVTPCSNCLLIGVGGTSRQTLVRLGAVIVGNIYFQPTISKDYGLEEWRSDLKYCLVESGGHNKEVTLMFSDYQIKYEDFLEDLNCLVSTGEVPNMFTRIEKQEILDLYRLCTLQLLATAMVRSAAQGGISSVEISLVEAFKFFISRCKLKLHIMLSFNHTFSEYRRRLHSYTNLVTCCDCIWFEPWTDDALEKVAQRYLSDAHVSDQTKTAAVDVCKYFHLTAGPVQDNFYRAVGLQTYISASNFVLLTKSFTYTVNTKKEETEEVRDHYLSGLGKLHYADKEVQKLLDNLMDLRSQLADTTKKLEQTKLNIIYTQKQHAAQTKKVEKQRDITEKQREVTKGLQDNCDEIMSEATPFLEDANEKLNALKPSDMTNLKGMKQPPDGVRVVMTAVCLLKDVKPDRITDPASGKKSNDYWGPAKKLLADFRFLFNLKTFDKDNIPPAVMKKVRAEIKKPEFNAQAIAKASKAAEAICLWVAAMDVYERVSKVLEPKKVVLAEAEAVLQELSTVLSSEEEKQKDLEAKLLELNRVREETADHKADLEAREAEADSKWQRADRLIRSLEGERIHWTEASDSLQLALDNLPGNVLVSCGVMAYLSPFTSVYRTKCIEDWHAYIVRSGIPSSTVYDFVQALGLDLKTRSWIIAGLPRDHFTLESAVIVDNSQRWSIMVDPQSQGNKWIKNVEKKNGLEVVKFTDATYVGTIENCIMFGRPALLENIGETLEPPLDPVLLKRMYLKDGSLKIMLSKEVEYNTKFRFYITTKLQKPRYSFHDYNKITLVNFYLPIEGLQEQLLTIVVKSERPDMEDQRQNLLLQSATHVKRLEDIEQNIFETLAESTGNILEDDYAINVLNSSKLQSAILNK